MDDVEPHLTPEQQRSVRELTDALGVYRAYARDVDAGTALVNARDDPNDLVVAAEINVENAIATCRELGLTDQMLIHLLAPGSPGRTAM